MDKFEDTTEVVEDSVENVENSIGEAVDSTEIVQDSVEAVNDSMEMADGDRNHVAVEIQDMLASVQPFFTNECCIYRVPPEVRNLKEDAYTPKVVSIGPFHRGDTKLLPMEVHKKVYCLKFTERSEVSLDDLVNCVQEAEPQVRRCYSDEIKLNKEEFVKLILVDCGFVIEFLLRLWCDESTEDDVNLTSWFLYGINLDLLLLENQLPFFIFEKLYNLAFDASILNGDYPLFRTLSFHYFKNRLGKNLAFTGSIAHFTDLLRTSHLQPSNKRPPRVEETLDHIYSATELNEAGVKFRLNDTSQCILDLQLSGHYLEIPRIKVSDETEMLLRNVVALEQCRYPNESYIIDYVVVMAYLINTDKDVDVLVKSGIIVNWLGDDNEVAELFNSLGKYMLHADFNTDYRNICNNLNAYCKHPLHSKTATLKRDYCNTPWKTVASIAGIALLILTIIQTVFSICK